jgi:hypothetical protein
MQKGWVAVPSSLRANGARIRATRWLAMTRRQQACKAFAGSPTICGCLASETAGDIRITSA